MTVFDYIILTILIYSSFVALIKGFIRTFISLTSWLISIIGTYLTQPYIYLLIKNHLPNLVLAKIIAGLISYFTILMIVNYLGYKIVNLTTNIRGGVIDRSLGISLGLFRGILISWVLFYLALVSSPFYNFNLSKPKWLTEAKSYTLLNYINKIIMLNLANNNNSIFDNFFETQEKDSIINNFFKRKTNKSVINHDLE